jgi:hypothetical protein
VSHTADLGADQRGGSPDFPTLERQVLLGVRRYVLRQHRTSRRRAGVRLR